jgi:long-chain acyl-CoA synthetase
MGAGRQKIDLIAASLFFNTYPLPVNSVGLKDALEHTGDLVDRGYSILIFPEGLRTEDGNLLPFRNGAGVMATELKIPVLPILIKGVFEIWPVFARGPRMKGIVQLRFGKPFEFSEKSAVEITRVMERWFQENYKGIP